MTVTDTQTATKWALKGVGYEYCNCNPGCTCNFSGFPTSSDGSCKAVVANVVTEGRCGDVDLAGVTAVAVIDWPRAIHDGGGKAVFVVAPDTSDEQVDELSQIYTGQLGGEPWSILATTFEVVGLTKATITVDDRGIDSSVEIDGIGRADGRSLRNPVTDEKHEAHIVMPDGFIWNDGLCGVGSFNVATEGIQLDFSDTNWIRYDFDWTN
ncbi:MAG: DUF1326 domain-containing protein [Nocardioidaceae bacterium]|nr:DUF1326 domain-containing protein [Nocardioidaceae bacterium]